MVQQIRNPIIILSQLGLIASAFLLSNIVVTPYCLTVLILVQLAQFWFLLSFPFLPIFCDVLDTLVLRLLLEKVRLSPNCRTTRVVLQAISRKLHRGEKLIFQTMGVTSNFIFLLTYQLHTNF